MPELPEVETTRRGITPHICGHQITRTVIRQTQLRWPVSRQIADELPGYTISHTSRRGKYLLLHLQTGLAALPPACLMVHLGMSGSLRIAQPSQAIRKHDHVDLLLSNGLILRYHDPRRFGAILWVAGDPAAHPLLASLGPEPLADHFDADYLFRRSRHRKVPVKSFIMDSHIVVGVGNIYANEALFMAGMRPQTIAGTISRTRYERLVRHIKGVISQAIDVGGTTLRDFVGGDGKPGYFQQSLLVYGRGGEDCRQCGRILDEIRLGQRSTVFCRRCQR